MPVISRREALGVAIKQLGDEPVIHANGYVCRESFAAGDRPQNFYMIGSMGLASAIGLGLALVRPASGLGRLRRRRQSADEPRDPGDGRQPRPAELRPRRLRQRGLRLDGRPALALARGPARPPGPERGLSHGDSPRRRRTRSPRRLQVGSRSPPGPHFVLVKVTAAEAAAPRIPHTPAAIRDRFRRARARAVDGAVIPETRVSCARLSVQFKAPLD